MADKKHCKKQKNKKLKKHGRKKTSPTGIEVRPSNIRISFQLNGRRYRESLNMKPTKANITKAIVRREMILDAIERETFDYIREFPNSRRAKREAAIAPGTTLEKLTEEFLQTRVAEVTSSTMDNYRRWLDRSLDLLGRDKPIRKLWPKDIQMARSSLITRYLPSTVNQQLSILRALLTFAHQNGIAEPNLAQVARPVRSEHMHPAAPFTHGEFNQILDSCTSDQDRNILILLVHTGLRPGELCTLAVEDIDFQQRLLHVQRSVTRNGCYKLPKTNRPRTIELSPEAVECLWRQQILIKHLPSATLNITTLAGREEQQTLHLLFSPKLHRQHNPKRSNYLPDSLSSRWRQIIGNVCQKHPDFRYRPLYQLRHTFACWQLSAGAPMIKVRDELGHTSLTHLEKTYGRWINHDRTRPEASSDYREQYALPDISNAINQSMTLERHPETDEWAAWKATWLDDLVERETPGPALPSK